MKIGVFIYEKQQFEYLLRLPQPADGEEYEFISCSADIEFLLEEKNIPFRSARDLRPTSAYDRLIFTEHLSRKLFENHELSFFSYRDIDLGKLYATAFQYYFAALLYYVDIVVSAFEKESYSRVITFSPSQIESPTGGLMHTYDVRIFMHAIQIVCKSKGVECAIQDFSSRKKPKSNKFRRILYEFGIQFLNHLVLAVVPRKKIRIIASEQWKNIYPFMNEFPESELLLLDRAESVKAGLANIFRNRICFIHTENFATKETIQSAKEYAQDFSMQWNNIKDSFSPLSEAIFRDCSLKVHVEQVMFHIITVGGERAVRDIEATYAMFARTTPDVLLVRASVSAQTHFAILCYVARSLGIPSIEIQHGAFYFGKESFSRNRAAEYIAEYGPLVRKQLKTIGYNDAHLFDVGSPRFDAYKAAQNKREKNVSTSDIFNVVFVPIDAMPGFWTDTYDVFDYFQSMADAVRDIPNVKVAVRLRPGPHFASFYKEVMERTFNDIEYRIAQHDLLVDLLPSSQAVVSCYSTVLTEALLSKVPVIYAAVQPMHAILSAEYQVYEDVHAVRIVRTTRELADALKEVQKSETKELLVANAENFMDKNYSFDGHSSERLVEIVKALTEKSNK